MKVTLAWTDAADRSLPLPSYETTGAAGADIRANFARETREQGLTLGPGDRGLVPTGLRCAVPQGYELQVRPRSGLALRKGLTCLNAPGTIDADYRGEIGVIVINHGTGNVTISHGERIAQLVLAPVTVAGFELSDELDETDRGSGGFGSTGAG